MTRVRVDGGSTWRREGRSRCGCARIARAGLGAARRGSVGVGGDAMTARARRRGRRMEVNSDVLFRSIARSQGAVETHARGKSDDATSLLKVLRAANEKAKREFLATDRGVVAVCDCVLTVRWMSRRGLAIVRSFADVGRERRRAATSIDSRVSTLMLTVTRVSIAGAQASDRSMEHSSARSNDDPVGGLRRFGRDRCGPRA